MSVTPPQYAVTVLGEAMHCPMCRHDRFHQREAKLNTTMASFFGFDWANASATCFVCARCAHIQWFLNTSALEIEYHSREQKHTHSDEQPGSSTSRAPHILP